MNTTRFLKRAITLIVTSLLMIACGKNSALLGGTSCASETTQATLQNGIKDTFEKYIKSQSNLDISKARATFSQLKMVVDNVRTTKEDPNSTKKFCAGTVKLSVPSELLNSIENTVELAKSQVTFRQSARAFGLEADANVFSKEVEYSVQPSDDGKSLFTELEQGKAIANFIGLITTIDQRKGQVEAQLADNAASVAIPPSDAVKQQAPNAFNDDPAPVSSKVSNGGRLAHVYDPPSNIRTKPDGVLLCTITKPTNITVYEYAGTTYDGTREVKWYYTDACGSMGVMAYSQFR